MPFVVVANNNRSASGTSVPDATEALNVIGVLESAGYEIAAVFNEWGVTVEVAELRVMAQAEQGESRVEE